MKKNALLFVSLILSSLLFSQSIVNENYELFAPDGGNNDYFGTCVSIYKEYAAVGAPNHDDSINGINSGAVYIYKYDEMNDTWDFETKLTASDGNAGDEFGRQISIYKDDIFVVGAHNHTHSGLTQVGAVYVYQKSAGNWVETKITAPDAAAYDHFGRAVHTGGLTLVIGALDKDTYGTNSGGAYIYKYVSGSWFLEQQVYGSSIGAGDNFGQSVCHAGKYIVIGAMYDDDNGNNAGAAYVFHKGTTWTEQAKILAPDGQANDWFGNSVSTDSTTLVVGAMMEDQAATNAGAAYVFSRSGTVWNYKSKYVPTNAAAEDRFGGGNVGVNGEHIVVGNYANNTTYTDAGLAYLYTLTPGVGFTLANYLQSDNVSAGDWFSRWVDISNKYIIIGAAQDDNINGTNAGAAYIFKLPPSSSKMMSNINLQESEDADIQANAISLYPNPVITDINIESNSIIERVEVIDINGKVVKAFNCSDKIINLNLDELVEGFYKLQIISKDRFYQYKIIKM